MQLNELSQEGAYIYLERFVNNPKYSKFAQYSETSKEYHPRFGEGQISIPYKFCRKVKLMMAYPDAKILSDFAREGIPFFTHPQFSKETPDGFVNASPTASTRSVLIENKPYFIKLHFPARISRFNRRLTESSVEHSILISSDIEESLDFAPKSFAYLPESIGIVHREGHGCILREKTPRPLVKDNRMQIPFFALYSKDPSNKEQDPLIVQMIKSSKSTPLDFFINKIVHPFIECWAWFAKNRGILLESHCQNTLLEVDESFKPKRIVYRDFQSIMVDAEVRKQKNLDIPFKKHVIGTASDPFPAEQEYSIVYDHFVAHYVFPFFTECLKEYFAISEIETQNAIKNKFRELFPDWEKYFPKTEYKLEDQIFENNEVKLVNTNELPKFR
jgi:hypothetical protein